MSALIAGTAAVALLLSGCATSAVDVGVAQGAQAQALPQASQTIARGPFVSAANPLAVEAGMKVLASGGFLPCGFSQ